MTLDYLGGSDVITSLCKREAGIGRDGGNQNDGS